MGDLKKYLKYYFLEDYLFNDVNKNFQRRGYLTPEEFFAIVIWKRNASKTKILNGIKKNKRTIREITSKISAAKTKEQTLDALLFPKIPGIGIAFASAILTVCYPNDFTVADYRAYATLKDFGVEVAGNPTVNVSAYFEYLKKCKELARKHNLSLRNFDRILWAKDFYEGANGLKRLAGGVK